MRPQLVLVIAGVLGVVLIAIVGATSSALRSAGLIAAVPTAMAKPAAPPTTAPTAVPPQLTAVAVAKPTEPPPPPTTAPAPTVAPAAEQLVISGAGPDGVNMRAEPSTTAARVKLLKDGTAVEIAGPDRDAGGRTWRNVKDTSDGATGWVAADFVAAATVGPAPTITAVARSAPVSPPQTATPVPATPTLRTSATPVPVAKPTAPTGSTQRSPEELLAIIQYGGSIRTGDPRITPFAQQLDRLEAKCTEDRRKLADLTAGANKAMSDRGTTEPILDTIGGVATASEGLPSEQACTDLFTSYALMRVNGVPGAAPKPAAPAPNPAAPAQPTAVPKITTAAGSGIVCNDGYHWPGSTRQGACSRHGGIAPGY